MELQTLLQGVRRVALGGHVRPDGDCVGSTLGLYQYLQKENPEISADVYLEPVPDSFRFIGAVKDIRPEVTETEPYDLFILLDCGDSDRLGFSKVLYEQAKRTACIDHHISNQAFADENEIDPDASSTSELVYRLLDKEKITKEIAECLYLGIVHDTGVFQYSCTAPETMEAAAELMRKGIDYSGIIDRTFYQKSYVQNQVLGKALVDSRLFLDGKCIASSLTREEMEFYGVAPKELDGIVSQLRVTKGVETAIFLYELSHHEFKVSLRATGEVDVSKIAQKFGGGGHKKAAGATMRGSSEEVLSALLEEIGKAENR
nr:bifunctional oligoribonuclease/PAP phosphatase NrnA [uncultured Faecalimonas sp.]